MVLPWDYGIDTWINYHEFGPEQWAITTIGGESGALPVLDDTFVSDVLASSNRSLWVHRLVYALFALRSQPIPPWVDMQVVQELNLSELLFTYWLG